jgi:phosphate-selective porin OprO and OprP
VNARSDGEENIEVREHASCVECSTRAISQGLYRAGSKTIQLALGVVLLLGTTRAMSQEVVSPHAGGTDVNLPQPQSKSEALSPSPQLSAQDSDAVKKQPYTTPDLPDPLEKWTRYSGKDFAIGLGMAILIDYDSFSQDANSKQQIGVQDDQWDARSVRFFASGGIGPKSYRVSYLAAYGFSGFDAPQNHKNYWGFTDLYATFPAGKLGALTYGKQKECFVYEMVGDAAYLYQAERNLTPFFTSRNVGLMLANSVLSKRMTYTAGWFNDWYVTGVAFDKSGNQFASRITGLLSINDDGSKYWHLAASGRYAGATNGFVQLRGRPLGNVGSYVTDTGKIPATGQADFGLETLWNYDSFSILAEYARAFVDGTPFPKPSFYGFYVAASWVLTGEHHPYDRNVGYARRIIPQHHFGAVELTAMFGRNDLDDKSIEGGISDKTFFGVNWLLNRRLKLGVAGGVVTLDRAGLTGTTKIVQPRIQYIF